MRWNLAGAALAASWGFVSILVEAVDLPATILVFYRVGIGALAIAALLALAGRRDELVLRSCRGRATLIGAALALHWWLFFETIKLSSVALGVLTVYTAPILLALLAPLFLPERRSPVAAAALLPAAGGIALIALAGGDSVHATPEAVAAGLGGALSYACLVMLTKSVAARVPPASLQLWTYATAAVVLAPFLAAASRVAPSAGDAGYLVLLGALFTGVSGVVYVVLLRRITSQTAGVLSYLEVVSAALLARALLGDALGWTVVVGGLLVAGGGVAVVVLEPAEAAAVEAAPALPVGAARGEE